MKRKFSIIALLSLPILVLNSCSDSKSNDGLTFTNDMETIFAWSDNAPKNILYFNNAHSGKYVCMIDSSNIFSTTFNMNAKAISSSPLKRVTIGAWFNSQQNGSEPNIAIDIRDKDGSTIDWIAQSGKDLIKSTGEWTWVEMSVDLTSKNRNALDNSYRVYAFNKNGSGCLVDDIEISYEK